MKIKNEKEYIDTINSINDITKKGEGNVTFEELQALQDKTAQVQEYEDKYYAFPVPKTIIDMVKIKIFERDMSQTDLAKRKAKA